MIEFLTSGYLWLKGKDEICPIAASNLHFRSNINQKTLLGGMLSFSITLYVCWIAYTKGRQMLEYDHPDISSIAEMMNYERIGKVPFSDISLPLLEIHQGGDQTVDLELDDYRKYFHMRVRNIEKKFMNGKI